MVNRIILVITSILCLCMRAHNENYEPYKQQFIKMFDLKEPSPEIYTIAADAIQACDIKKPLIILEDPKQHTAYEGFVYEAKPYSLFVLTSLRNNSTEEKNSKTFIAYHECGHLHHSHHAHRLLVDKLKSSLSNNIVSDTFVATQKLHEKINEGYDLHTHYREQEKQADLFACERLIQKGRTNVVIQSIIAPHAAEGDISHPSTNEVRNYLKECLLQKGPVSPNIYHDGLKYAISFNNSEFIHKMLDEAAPAYIANDSGFTALHRASQNGDYELGLKLIHLRAPLNARDQKGLTPLFWAIEFKKENMVNLLISHGAAVNIKDAQGFTPLHHAVEQGNKLIVQQLLKAGANKMTTDPHGLTPYDWSKSFNKSDIATMLK